MGDEYRWSGVVVLLVWSVGCQGAARVQDPALHPAAGAACEGKTRWLYAPENGELEAWPDDYWTADDPPRLKTKQARVPRAAASFKTVFADLETLDGFGVTAGAELMFSAPLDPTSIDAALLLFALDSPFEPIAVDWELVDDPRHQTLIVSPRAPLRPRTRYGLVLTRNARAIDGDCVRPSQTLSMLLARDARTKELARLHDRYAQLLSVSAFDAADLSAALVFTTGRTIDDSATIAADIAARTPVFTRQGCEDGVGYRKCRGVYSAIDYRLDHRVLVDGELLDHQTPYLVPVDLYLPNGGASATILFAHGLSGSKAQAASLAERAAKDGFAVVAIDAVEHGEHPTARGGGSNIQAILDFFALDPNAESKLDGLRLRDNWRQSTYDKLQLIELLRAGVDADGDGHTDIDARALAYYGVSLGAVMAAELLALSPDVRAAVVNVPGARVTNIIKDGAMFALVIEAFRGTASNSEVARFFPVLQTLIDRGDAGAYLQHVHDKQVLMQMVIDDEIVPNPANRFFARGLGLPQLGDLLQPMPPLEHAPSGPWFGSGVYQFDLVMDGEGTEKATHTNTGNNPVAAEQALHFFRTWRDSGRAEIIDTYRTLNVKRP